MDAWNYSSNLVTTWALFCYIYVRNKHWWPQSFESSFICWIIIEFATVPVLQTYYLGSHITLSYMCLLLIEVCFEVTFLVQSEVNNRKQTWAYVWEPNVIARYDAYLFMNCCCVRSIKLLMPKAKGLGFESSRDAAFKISVPNLPPKKKLLVLFDFCFFSLDFLGCNNA